METSVLKARSIRKENNIMSPIQITLKLIVPLTKSFISFTAKSKASYLLLSAIFLTSDCGLAPLAQAAQSLIVTPTARVQRQIPAGTSGWKDIGSYRLEGRITINSPSTGQQPVFRVESDFGIILDGSGNIGTFIRDGAGGVFCPLNSSQHLRFRMRRDIAAAKYSLETWDEQNGSYCVRIFNDPTPVAYDLSARIIAIGAVWEPQSPNIDVSCIRIYSSAGLLSDLPPARILTSGFADLVNFELENNLLDQSGRGLHLSISGAGAAYRAVPIFLPQVSLINPGTSRAGSPIELSANAFVNDNSQNLSVSWIQVEGPMQGIFRNTSGQTTQFTPPLFGNYKLRVTASSGSGQERNVEFSVGGVVTDPNGVVLLSNQNISRILGPLIRMGANPWSWFDDRSVAAAEPQIAQQTRFWNNEWDTPNGAGTVAVTNASATLTGSGTQFQTRFCGGSGNTVPVSPTNYIGIHYNSEVYSGTTGRAFYIIKECTSQTSLRLGTPGGPDREWVHATGSQSGLLYWVPSNTDWIMWGFSGTPGNYYDNVLAFYSMYYRTGLIKYRDAARTLARNFWYGPFYDRGKNYDYLNGTANFIGNGPARGQSITGLILWAIESGENIWPGLDYVLEWFRFAGHGYAAGRSWNVQIGDLREQGYLTAGYALCSQYHPDPTKRTQCRGWLKDYVNLFWTPLQISASKEWRNTNFANALFHGSSFVTVANGSTNITLTGATWSDDTFYNQFFAGSNKLARLFFFNNYSNIDVPGKTNADLGGDSVFYTIATVTSPTTAQLTAPYAGTSGNKGLGVGHFAGFGTQPFMLGLVGGVFGTYAYDALIASGDTAEAVKVRQFAIDAASWLTTTGFDSTNHSLYSGRAFINCEPNGGGDPACASGAALNGEAQRTFTAAYLLAGDDKVKIKGDDIYTRLWCKPTGGWSCGTPGFGTYLNDIDTISGSGGYMIDVNSAVTNKWFGFYFGYGFGAGWPAARLGGVSSPIPRTVSVPLVFESVANTDRIRITLLFTTGDFNQVTCTSSPCAVSVDARLGNPLMRIEYYSSNDTLLSLGDWSVLPVD